jgi:hypothetical protein
MCDWPCLAVITIMVESYRPFSFSSLTNAPIEASTNWISPNSTCVGVPAASFTVGDPAAGYELPC